MGNGQLTAKVMDITPQVAAEWLAMNSNYRRLSERRAERLAEQMKSGRWDVNGEAIKFNGDGTLKDGQHRLRACVLADRPFQSLVCWNVASDVNMDTGQRRTFADLLRSKGETNAVALSAAVVWLWRIRTTRMVRSAGAAGGPGHAELLALFHRNKKIVSSVQFTAKCKPLVSNSYAGTLHYLFSEVDPEVAEAFFNGLAHGENLKQNDPLRRLRERLLRDKTQNAKLTIVEKMALIIKAFNLYNAGRECQQIYWRASGPTAEEFPQVGVI
jgi:hypothetical protein